ncbi:hypothetical protein M3O96_01330 [Aquiflexum sp. TKW24L]|uniref:hypothetical protein n=1 Tax=Aquiflexum sp. TKW24L TaxID=2942212 RepID=UPI0020C0083E|nr:hypothetical protein [Aquiflexum sp. TKW24L]MCL6257710.1 hypothetical protein [Aquiflexum sp. TKW24L]
MIKFFRRIRQKLLAEGNLRRYLIYAFGEILLVVIGILLALQINDWNQNRLNAKEERRIYQDITDGFQLSRFLFKNGIGTWETVIGSADSLLRIINNPAIRPEDEKLAIYIHQLTLNWMSGTSTTVYDVLGSSGDLEIISSELLRNSLAEYKYQMEHLKQSEESYVRFADQELRPFLNRFVDRSATRGNREKGQWIITHHPSPFRSSFDDLIQSREFANLLIDLIDASNKLINVNRRLEVNINQIDSLILAKYRSIQAKPYIPK